MGYTPRGLQRAEHDLVTEHTKAYKESPSKVPTLTSSSTIKCSFEEDSRPLYEKMKLR